MVSGFNLVAVGGTFDRLHLGHELMLDTAFRVGKKVLIGLTVDEVLRKKEYAPLLLSCEKRRSTLNCFLKSRKYSSRAEIFLIDDGFGNYKGAGGADKLAALEAIVVSAERRVIETAFSINEARAKNGLKPLCIIGVPLLEVAGRKVSSTLIRGMIENNAGDLSKYTRYPDG